MTSNFVIRDLSDGTLQIGDGSKTAGNGVLDKTLVSANFIIPEKINNKYVTVIGQYAFYCLSGIKTISFPNSLKEIQYSAFDGVHLNIDVLDLTGSQLKILGTYAFSSNVFRKALLGKEVERIDGCPFISNSLLEEIIVDEQNKFFSNDIQGALYDKKQTRLIQVPLNILNFTIPETVTFIDFKAFEYVIISTLTIPSGVKRIAQTAFLSCNSLKEIYFYCTLTDKMQLMFHSIKQELKIYYMRERSVTVPLFQDSVAQKVYVCSKYKGSFSNYTPIIKEGSCFVPNYITNFKCNRNNRNNSLLISILIFSSI